PLAANGVRLAPRPTRPIPDWPDPGSVAAVPPLPGMLTAPAGASPEPAPPPAALPPPTAAAPPTRAPRRRPAHPAAETEPARPASTDQAPPAFVDGAAGPLRGRGAAGAAGPYAWRAAEAEAQASGYRHTDSAGQPARTDPQQGRIDGSGPELRQV